MVLKLNVQKRGLSTTAETINEEFTLHYGHIFKGEKGDKGADGKSAYQQAVEAGYKGSEEDFKGLLLSYPNKADKNGYYPNMSVGIADDVKNGNTKYLAATPSGDPMHYAYEAEGAVWNASTGYWEFYDMKDITNEQMRKAYSFGSYNVSNVRPLAYVSPSAHSYIRFNLPRQGMYSQYVSDMSYFAYGNYIVEVVNIAPIPYLANIGTMQVQAVNLTNAFGSCSKLRRVFGRFDCSMTTNVTSMFSGCTSLEDVHIYGLKLNISFADSPNLSTESILYMIENATATTAITITLHEDAYMRAQDSDDIIQALDRKEKVSIACA